ncbi:AbiTii domain-containing protein [Bradyrhizobium sp. URHC0002]
MSTGRGRSGISSGRAVIPGSWSGPFGSGINNAPIPSYLIEKHASKHWTQYKVRESIASVQEMAASGKTLGINASDLILLLQGKVYEDLACNSITAEMSPVAPREIVQAVRARILELTIELEKRVPDAVKLRCRK